MAVVNSELANQREEALFQLMHELLEAAANPQIDHAYIDAQYLFRFDLAWCDFVESIRRLIRALIGQTDDDVLPPHQASFKVVQHLDINPKVQFRLQSDSSGTIKSITTGQDADGFYACLDQSLFEQLWNSRESDKNQFMRIQRQIWAEAALTAQIQAKLTMLEARYGLEDTLQWVTFGKIVPEFPWEMTQLVECKIDGGIKRIIMPGIAVPGQFHNRRPMSNGTRIRTWTIYYLTRRGGGHMTEAKAIELWDRETYAKFQVMGHNYRKERARLFKRGTIRKKRMK